MFPEAPFFLRSLRNVLQLQDLLHYMRLHKEDKLRLRIRAEYVLWRMQRLSYEPWSARFRAVRLRTPYLRGTVRSASALLLPCCSCRMPEGNPVPSQLPEARADL